MNLVLDRKTIANSIFVFATFSLAASISVSKFTTSLSIFLLAFSWFLQWNWSEKLKLYADKKIQFWVLILPYLLFSIGLIYSTDINYALKDLRIKAPVFALPVLFITGYQINRKQIIWTLVFLGASAIAASIIGFINYQIKIGTPEEISDLRRLSPFISHIRLVLILCFTAAFIIWGVIHSNKKNKWLLVIPFLWISYFIFFTASLTGLVLLPLLIVFSILYFLWEKNRKTAIFLLVSGLLLLSAFGLQIHSIYQLTFTEKPYSSERKLTALGNQYDNYETRKGSENGYKTWDYICEKELRETWNSISTKPFDSNLNDFPFKDVIIRYLTSMGLQKDAQGIKKLKTKDIKAIENGVANIYYTEHNPIANRIHISLWELKAKQEANYLNGGSLSMRLEFWKTGFQIFKSSPIIGIGTGDIDRAYKAAYTQNNTVLSNRFQRRSHNQYLSVLITSGVVGLLLFLFAIFYPIVLYKGDFKFLFFSSIIILSISMLWEDTIETQAGVTIVALFYALFISNEQST